MTTSLEKTNSTNSREALRITAVSDIHGEFMSEEEMDKVATSILATDPDVIILAGDIHTGVNGARWVKRNLHPAHTGIAVIMTSGNHEYYSNKIDTLDEKITKEFHLASGYPPNPRFFDKWGLPATPEFLQNRNIEIEGVTFTGTSLWTDCTAGKTDEQEIRDERIKMANVMNDYKRIRLASGNYRKIKPTDTAALHFKAKQFLTETANQRTGNNPWVIITHHAPIMAALENFPPAQEDTFPFAACASNMEAEIREWNPDYWIHGHIHHQGVRKIGRTQILNVARGYPTETIQGLTTFEIRKKKNT